MLVKRGARVAFCGTEVHNADVLAWLARLLTPSEPSQPRLSSRVTALENLTDDFDSRIDYLSAELKSLRGRQYASEKRAKDDPGPTNGAEPSPGELHSTNARGYVPTAHLARRFKGA